MLGVLATTVVHPAGHGSESLWQAAAQGRTSLRRNDLAWCDLACWIGSVEGVDDVRLPEALQAWDCRNHRLAWTALQDNAFRDAVEAAAARYGRERIGLVLGTSTSGIRSSEQAYGQRRKTGQWPAGFSYRQTHAPDALSRFAARALALPGPLATLTTACSSSAKAFLVAQRWITAGVVDAAVVGGVDSLCLSTLHGFHALQLLSDEVCRPFDAGRRGISIGEAAGFALLDRTAAPVCLAAGGESSDAWHPSTPHPAGRGAQEALQAAFATAGLSAADIGYVNAHGTGTIANDRAESAALSAVFGEYGVPVSSTKGVTGHTLGAAGIVEALIVIQALERQAVPPSANLATPDPALPLDLVTALRHARLRHAVSASFGFGGNNCVLVFSHRD